MSGSKKKRTSSTIDAGHEKDGLKPPSQATKRRASPVSTNVSKRHKRTAIVRGNTTKDDSLFVGSADDNRRLRSNTSVYGGTVKIITYHDPDSTISSKEQRPPSRQRVLEAAIKAKSNTKSMRAKRRSENDSAEDSQSDDTGSSSGYSCQSSSCERDRGRSSHCSGTGTNNASFEDSGSEGINRPEKDWYCHQADLVAKWLKDIRINVDSAMKHLQPKNMRKGKKALRIPEEDELRKIRHHLHGIKTQTLVPDERDLALFRRRVFESENNQGGREDSQQIQEILSELESVLRKSESLNNNGEIISHYMPSRIGSNPYQEELYVEFATFNNTIRKYIKPHLASFQDLFHTFCIPNEHDYSIQIAKTLQGFKASRVASATLYSQLSKVCDLHLDHDTYFNLETGRKEKQEANNTQNNEIIFHIAIARKDKHKGHLVLLEANSKISVTPRSSPEIASRSLRGSSLRPGNRIRNKDIRLDGAMFCIGTLPSGMDFEFRVGVNLMHHPDPHININLAGREPVRLSEWITASTFRDQQSRVRLARLISEAVLKFDPRLWRETKLHTDKLMIIDPLKYTCQIESHISVPLRRWLSAPTAGLGDIGTDRHDIPDAAVPVGEVLLNLAITLLELANLEIIPRRYLEYSKANPKLWSRVEDGRLEQQMGTNYDKAVRYCLENCNSEYNMYDWRMQVDFYKKVVQLLKLDEVGSQPLVKLEEAGQAHSKSSQPDQLSIETKSQDVAIQQHKSFKEAGHGQKKKKQRKG